MAALSMSYEEVFAQLEAWGSEGTCANYAKMGAGEYQFGVGLGPLRALAKKLKTNHALAMQLWHSGNTDAMILATMLMDSAQLSVQEVDAMLQPLTYFRLVDEFANNVAVKNAFASSLRQQWMASALELIGRAGWDMLIAAIMKGDAQGIDFEDILQTIESELKSALPRKQEIMNRALVEIATHCPALTQRCLEIGEAVGHLDDKPTPKGCVSSYAPEWIAAVLKRG